MAYTSKLVGKGDSPGNEFPGSAVKVGSNQLNLALPEVSLVDFNQLGYLALKFISGRSGSTTQLDCEFLTLP